MKRLAQQVKEIIKSHNYYVSIQYSENVKESALDRAENTTEEYFAKITDKEIQEYTNEIIEEFGDDANATIVLTHIANRNCDCSGHETMVCFVIVKE